MPALISLPVCQVAKYHGTHAEAALSGVISGEIDVLLTTYDKLRNEVDALSEVGFHAVIADEVHKLKNQKSKVYEAAVQLAGVRRYGLTGTPMQNK